MMRNDNQMGPAVSPVADRPIKCIRRREVEHLPNAEDNQPNANHDDTDPNPARRPVSDKVLRLGKGLFKIGTWNVRTLYQSGKSDNLIHECDRLKAGIKGLSEVRWLGSGKIQKDGFVMVYSGNDVKHQNGVGMVMTARVSKALLGYIPVSDRVIVAKFEARPVNLVCVQVYAPKKDHAQEEVESFYDDIKKAINLEWRHCDNYE